MKIKWVFYIVVIFLIVPPTVYRFRHPEKTETQLFLNLIQAYREFFILQHNS